MGCRGERSLPCECLTGDTVGQRDATGERSVSLAKMVLESKKSPILSDSTHLAVRVIYEPFVSDRYVRQIMRQCEPFHLHHLGGFMYQPVGYGSE